ncbi:hypothetical protein [Pannonibacter indicus]|jgi:hypothetical protein|nr:hypothetical protein [Pannonibacter indicus]CUA95891.1 hypothetical protein Ga0061067_104204 [Pannonibacter indicus]
MNTTFLSSLKDVLSSRVSTPVAVWLAALAGLVLLMGAGIARIDTIAAPLPPHALTPGKPAVKDPHGCAELRFLKEEPACSYRARDDKPRNGGPAL